MSDVTSSAEVIHVGNINIDHLIILVYECQEIYNPCHPKHQNCNLIKGV
jgi:hypothetical protein